MYAIKKDVLNEAIFKEAGIKEFPSTWSEFIDACKTIKTKGYTPIVVVSSASNEQ